MPVIGILSMPMTVEGDADDVSFIDTSYVKYVQGGGATVVPIFFNSTAEQVQEQFEHLDGIFFTGGAAMPTSFPRYFATAQLLYKMVVDQGKTLWGTCLGFQTITDIVSAQPDGVLGKYPAMNMPMSLNLTSYGDQQSKIYSQLPGEMKRAFTQGGLTENWHNYGVGVDTFAKYMEPAGFQMVSTNVDTNGVEFVSTFEHPNHRIYATQWHPEANQYDPDPKGDAHIVHSSLATAAMGYMAGFIAENARLSKTTQSAAAVKKQQHMLQGHQSDLPNAIELYPVRAVVTSDDTAFHYHFE